MSIEPITPLIVYYESVAHLAVEVDARVTLDLTEVRQK